MIDALQDLLDVMLQLRLAAWIIPNHLDGIVSAHGRSADLQFGAGGSGCLIAAGQQQKARQYGDSQQLFHASLLKTDQRPGIKRQAV